MSRDRHHLEGQDRRAAECLSDFSCLYHRLEAGGEAEAGRVWAEMNAVAERLGSEAGPEFREWREFWRGRQALLGPLEGHRSVWTDRYDVVPLETAVPPQSHHAGD